MSACLGAGVALLLAASGAPVRATGPVVEWRCDEQLAIGRAKTVGYRDLAAPGDLLGRDEWQLSIRVRTWLRGSGPRQLEAVRRGHGRLRRGRDFLFILAPDPDHGLAVRAAILLADGAVLAVAGDCTIAPSESAGASGV